MLPDFSSWECAHASPPARLAVTADAKRPGHIAARHDEGVLPPAALDLQAEAIIPPGSRLPPLLPSTHDDLDDAVARDIAHRAIVPLVTAPAR